MIRTAFIPIVATLAALAGGTACAQDAASRLRQESLAASCAACHGTRGHPVDGGQPGTMPPLAGLDAAYLSAQMHAFRDGKRPSTAMEQIAKGYDDAQIESLAAYFAAQDKK